MKVSVSVPGRFHAFYLARFLKDKDLLGQLFTTYPRFEVLKYGIPASFVSSRVSQEVLARASFKVPRALRLGWNPQHFWARSFDEWVCREMKEGSDIFIGFSGSSLASLSRARSLGMIRVLERSSCHMTMQQEILSEEFAKMGKRFVDTHPEIISRELREYEEADYISVPSEFVRQSFVKFGVSKEKLILTPLGVDLKQFSPGEKKDSRFRVICSGSVSIQKGTRYLIEAFQNLALPESELWIVGAVAPEMRQWLSKISSPSIRILGHQKQSELASFYRQCDVACVPSIQDGFAVVLPQAMACGLPVICTENTGAKDLIEEGRNGFVVPIRDVKALMERIDWCYHHQDQVREMGGKALASVQKGFSWDVYGERIVSSLLKRKACVSIEP
jgi:glycosyltransferase involved in cell wall biosynthesis